ncbi:hypothetical protein HNQ60_004460 [Povalibacter uvarum]|uniref:DUF4440 domain-containing protein n=1 Tax=Povalibacter uvarum TaxID=732238 RepID=A0A841HTN3_9GAMM|nr:DUF4440 domain-containing protein [Povalibacter uvarum]MBB6095570.1 hypothetical protein [Povalibacter uvarum]
MKITFLPAILTLCLISASQVFAATDTEIAQTIRSRLDAYRQGDAARWGSFVDDDCLCAGETKADILKAIANRPSTVRSWFGDPGDIQVRFHEGVAAVRYRITEFTEVNGHVQTLEQRRMETYLRRADRWILIAAAENLIPSDPQPIALPRQTLATYVGKYQYAPGSIDDVTLEGDRLFVESTGEAKVEILAENPTTFFARGREWRLVFRPDQRGAAKQVVFRQQGQEFVGERVP